MILDSPLVEINVFHYKKGNKHGENEKDDQ